MTRYSVQTATKQTRSSGTAQPAPMPSSQRSNGRRHCAGARSDRSAIAWNAKSIGKGFKSQEGKQCARQTLYLDRKTNSNDWNLEQIKVPGLFGAHGRQTTRRR